MELVSEAGIDVAAWSNYKLGRTRPASNPKYCYKWAFLEPGRQAILNIWHDQIIDNGGIVFFNRNFRLVARERHGAQKSRAKEFDETVATAYADRLPVRMIVLDGPNPEARVRKVGRRLLDAEFWHVTSYEQATGECTIVRGAGSSRFADQYSVGVAQTEGPGRRQTSGYTYDRSRRVRDNVLASAGGRCELCGRQGFEMWDHRIYLETHHVKKLSEGGADTEANVVAICPDDHKRAHFGFDRHAVNEELLRIAARREKKAGRA